ncbi:MAG: TIGR03545 family protein [Deltaproteobacteria bacterium]|nr:TIGR03545 family protein [Deltaproteobacteria bacterium]
MKMIRWPGLIAFVVIVGIVAIFNFLFLDTILKGVLEKQASFLVGARVDIGDLDFRLSGLHVDIHNIQITDPEQTMRNAVEAGRVSFDLVAGPLLKKKIVIEEMGVQDLAFNTSRKRSGELPASLKRKREKIKKPLDVNVPVKGRLEECTLPDFTVLSDLKNRKPEDLLKGMELKSSEFFADYRKQISDKKQLWEKQLQGLPSKESLNTDLKSLQELISQRPKELTQFPAYIQKVNALQQRVNSSKNSLITARKNLQEEMAGLKTSLSVGEMEKLRIRDYKDVMAKLNIKTPSAEDLVCVLVGKKIAKKANSAITWYKKLDDFMPAGKAKNKEQAPTPVPRIKGTDVKFPIIKGYPDFLIEKADFSVSSDLPAEPGKLVFSSLSGKFQGITTQPSIYGKPALFDLKGSLAGNMARKVALSGTLDHRVAPAEDTVNLVINKFRLQSEDVGVSDDSPLRLTSANLDMDSNLRVSGENLEGRFLLTISEPKIIVGKEAAILTEVFRNIGTFDVVISIGGTLDQPSMAFSSSLTDTLQSRLKNVAQKEMAALQGGLKKAIASSLDKDLKESSMETDGFEKSVLGDITGRLDIANTILKKEPGSVKTGDKENPLDSIKEKLLPFSS